MGEADVYTKPYMDALRAGLYVDADVIGDNLIFTRQDGGTVDAGNVRGPTGATGSVGIPWAPGTAYTVGQYAGYAGILWRCIQAGTNKPPSMFGSYWQQVTGIDVDAWAQKDPYFDQDSYATSWELFWKTGTVTPSLTTTAGEFETGKQALKLVMAANSSQTIYTKSEENVVRGGETVLVYVRAKLRVGVASVTLRADLLQNDTAGTPTPLASGVASATSAQGVQTLTSSWQTFGLAMTAANAKPRATVTIQAITGANAADVLIDRIEIRRSNIAALFAPDVDWTALPFTSGWGNYGTTGADWAFGKYRRKDGWVYAEGLIKRVGANVAALSVFANLPAGFRPVGGKAYGTVINAGTGAGENWGGVYVTNSGDMSISTSPMNTGGYAYINTVQYEAVA